MPARKSNDPAGDGSTPSWMIARKTRCKTCDAVIRAPQDVSLGAAVRRHYWRRHQDVMMARRAEHEWDDEPKSGAARRQGPALAAEGGEPASETRKLRIVEPKSVTKRGRG